MSYNDITKIKQIFKNIVDFVQFSFQYERIFYMTKIRDTFHFMFCFF